MLAALGGCAIETAEDRAIRPLAVLDAYAIAHGMAASYAHSPDAKIDVVQELARRDRDAARAALAMVHTAGGGQAATEAAVSRLTNYAAQADDSETP